MPVPPSLKLFRKFSRTGRRTGWSWLPGLFFVAELRDRASNDVKSKTNESMKLVSVIFDIVLDPPRIAIYRPACRYGRRSFSHRLAVKVKTIFEILAAACRATPRSWLPRPLQPG